jgi:Allophanate hydrolase subunit 2
LLEVANAWDFLDMDEETEELAWRRKIFRTPWKRKLAIWVLPILYFLCASVSLYLAYLCLTGGFEAKTLLIAWTYVVLSAIGALAALSYGDNLKNADRAASRWLGMT